MKKKEFCQCLETLRKFGAWERHLYECGIDLEGTPASALAEKIHELMCGSNSDWAYDKKLEIDWILEWAYHESPYLEQERHGRKWILDDAGILYEFINFMNEYGWED